MGHGLQHQRSRVVCALRRSPMEFAMCRSSAYVFVHVLCHGELAHREALASDMLALPSEDLVEVATCHPGSSVVLALLQQGACITAALVEHLGGPVAQKCLMSNKWGRRVHNG